MGPVPSTEFRCGSHGDSRVVWRGHIYEVLPGAVKNTFYDTHNIHLRGRDNIMKIDCIVIRHNSPGACINLTKYVDAKVVNAGDGCHEHPTQGLLDMMSIKEKFGKIKGLKIGIVGDILHSRVARSNIYGLLKMGAKITVCGPANLIPIDMENFGVNVSYDIDSVIEWADVINV